MSQSTESNTPVAELWLLASDDDALRLAMQQELQASNEPLTAWRLQHGRVRLLPCAGLRDAVAEALSAGAAWVHVHGELSAAQLLHLADSAAAYVTNEAKRVLRHPGPLAASPNLLRALANPDTLVCWELDSSGLEAAKSMSIQVPGYGSEAGLAHAQALDQWGQTGGYDRPLPDDDEGEEDLVDQGPAVGGGDITATASSLWSQEGEFVPKKLTLHMPGMLYAPSASHLMWSKLLEWKGGSQATASDVGVPMPFTVYLYGRSMGNEVGPDHRHLFGLKLELALPAAAKGLRGVQVWLYPKLGDVIRLSLGDARDGARLESQNLLRLEQKLSDVGPIELQRLFQSLESTSILVSAEKDILAK